jgi:hypothetical protein
VREIREQRLPRREDSRKQLEEAGGVDQPLEPTQLIEPEPGDSEPQQARAREKEGEAHPAEQSAEWAAGTLALDPGLGRLDELAIGHTGRAHGLAGAAIQAE